MAVWSESLIVELSHGHLILWSDSLIVFWSGLDVYPSSLQTGWI